VLSIYTHYGTHVDLPWHFLAEGRTMTGFDIVDFVFENPAIVDIPQPEDGLVTADLLGPALESAPMDPDILLLRSGLEQQRGSKEVYEREGLGLDAEAARLLRDRSPALRAIGMDWLSLCSLRHVEAGVEAHRVLLDDRDRAPILIIEDMRLEPVGDLRLRRVIAAPLFVDGLDGSPCTVLGEVA
jgi:kynurenine formamidase